MNRWRERRKEKQQALAQAESFANPEPQSSTTFTKSLRRKQKNAPEEKVEIDLATALPDTQDFRTSLMMPAFSARFSMLRQQNDPTTKIGKANDDSVLFPKRASRLNLFSHNPLTDIAEVDSIRGSTFKPPFAENGRSYSIDGYASDDGGSIMARSKPGEGNNLFGGRQKVYRIPPKNGNDSETASMGGRHMYENDVSMSTFQQLRLRARYDGASEDTNARPESVQVTDPEDGDTVNSPSTGFSKNRGTTSSTTSAPSNRRTSTAATSVASESPALPQSINPAVVNSRTSDQNNVVERNGILHKRLYGQALDQVSPNRRNFRELSESAGRYAAPVNSKVTHRLSQSRSATNLGERFSRTNQVFATSSFRAASPPANVAAPILPSMDHGLPDGKRSASPSDTRYGAATPASEDEDIMVYTNHVQPKDRGKATAMGLFNRPQRQYDDQQFTQRQLQMAEGRNSPGPPREQSRADSRASEDIYRPRSIEASRRSPNLRKNSTPYSGDERVTDRGSPLAEHAPPAPPLSGRPRTKSAVSVAAAVNVKARAEELIRRQNAELAALEAQRAVIDPDVTDLSNRPTRPSQSVSNGTFLDTFDASDDELEVDRQRKSSRESGPRRPPEGIHPALRDGALDFDFGDAVSHSNTSASNDNSANTSSSSITALPSHEKANNDTLSSLAYNGNMPEPRTPAPGLGLSGLIHSHMRDNSAGSSIYPPPSPVIGKECSAEMSRVGSTASTTRAWNPPESAHSDPWDLDKFNNNISNAHREDDPRDASYQRANKAHQMPGQARSQKDRGKARQILGDEAPGTYENSMSRDGRANHQRGPSTETQKERDNFESELAERRRRVKETLKSAVDSESRTPSPGPNASSASVSNNPFAAMKHRSSKSSTRQGEHSSKAMKMLGISGPHPSQSTTKPRQESQWHEEEDRMLHDLGRRPKPRSPDEHVEGYRRSSPRDHSVGRSGSSTPYEEERSRMRSATPNSGRSSRQERDRSQSAASNRSKSRQGRYREGPEPAMPGAFPVHQYGDMRTPHMHGPPRRPSEPPMMDPRQYERSGSALSNRQRSNSRPGQNEQLDGRRRGPPLMAATMPSGQPMRSPRPLLSPADPQMPSPRTPQTETGMAERPSPPERTPYSPATRPDQPYPSPGMRPGPSGPSPRPAPMPVGRPRRASSPPGRDSFASTSVPPSPAFYSQAAAQSERSSPGIGGRKKSVSKNMISEPTFLSSTSSVPLVGLPNGHYDESVSTPSLPAMNPARRQPSAKTMFSGFGSNNPSMRPSDRDISSPLPSSIPESPDRMFFLQNQLHNPNQRSYGPDGPAKRQRNRLRKSSSEGGNMAAKAAKQAMVMDHSSSPRVPTFPNRSATNLRDGRMF